MKLLAACFVKAALAAGAWHALLAEAHEQEPVLAATTASVERNSEDAATEDFWPLWSPPQDVLEDASTSTTPRLLLEDLDVQVDFEDVKDDEGRNEKGHLFQGLLVDPATLLWSPHQDENSHGDYRDFEVASLGYDWEKLGENHEDNDADFDKYEYGDFEGYDNWIEALLDQEQFMNTQEELNMDMESKDWNEEGYDSEEEMWDLADSSTQDHDDFLQALEDLASSVFDDLEDENDENESETSEDQQVGVDSTRVKRKGLRAHRSLNEDADWSIPTRSELLELILRHIEFEKSEGRIIENAIIESIGMHLLNKHPDDEEWKDMLHDQVMDELTSLLDEEAPERDMIDVALAKAKGRSACGLEGHCDSEEEAESIKNFIKDLLDEYADNGQVPTGDDIIKRLQQELNMDPAFANELVNSNPEIQRFLERQLLIDSEVALSNQLKEEATEVANALIAMAANGTEIDDALAILGMTEDEVMLLIHAMSKSQTQAVLRALHKPLDDMKKKMEEADKKHSNDTHVYFEEVIEDVEIDDDTGERRLKFVPHPDKKSMKDHIAEIDKKLHQRKLSRRAIPADTADFSRRLKDHIEEVQHHVRELKAAACPTGKSKTMCDANRLDEVSNELSTMGDKALSKLGPLSLLLAKVQSGIRSIDVAEKLGELVIVALTLAAKIPKIGVIFTIGKQALGPVHKIMEKVDSSAGKFQKTVGKAWDNSIGRVEDVIGQFNAGAVAGVVAGATLVGTVATSTCSKSLINHLAGFNLVGDIENAVSALSKYMHTLLDALHGLLTALASKTLNGITKTLEKIMKGVDPITNVFQKFEPLATLIEKKVTINPWFKVPTAQKRFGFASCPGGYRPDYKSAGAGKTCWEKDSKDWGWYVSIPPKMRRKCSSIDMGKSIDGAVCVPKNYRTKTSGHKKKKWFKTYCKKGWKKYFTHCSQDCRSGYSRKPFDKCYQQCPRGWSSKWGGTACQKPTKKQGKKEKSCSKYRAAEGRKVSLNWLGECWQTCKSNEKLFLGMCFEKAKLTISIQDIFDAMKKIFDHIKDLPILGDILHAIESAVKIILKPITDLIEKGVKKLGLDGFPDIKEKVLGAEPFKKIAAGMPKPPDISPITDFSSRTMDKIMKQLPAPFDNAAECEGDFDCILKDAGIDREKIQEEIVDIFETAKNTASILPNLTKAITCKKWANHTIPVSDILAQAGFPDIDACDIQIPYCKGVDTSALGSLADEAMEVLQPFINKLKRRRLEGGDEEDDEDGEDDVFYPILSVQLAPGMLMDFKAPREMFVGGEAARLLPQAVKVKLFTPDGSDERDKPLERPIGFSLVFELELALNFGVSKRNGNWGLGVELSVKFETRVARTWATYSKFLEEVINIPYKLNDGFKASRYYKNCYRDPSTKSRDECRACLLNQKNYQESLIDLREGHRKLHPNLTESDPKKSITNDALDEFEMALHEYRKSLGGHADQAVSEVFGNARSRSFEVLPNNTSISQNTTQHRILAAARKVFLDDGWPYDPAGGLTEEMSAKLPTPSFKPICDAYIKSIKDKMMAAVVPTGCDVAGMQTKLAAVKRIPWNKKVPLEQGKAIQKCAQFWLRWEDRYDETMEDYYKQESKQIFTRGLKQEWWEIALSMLTLKTDWLSAGLGAYGHGPGGVEWIGEHGAEEMLSWGVGIDIINDGGVSGSRIGPQFNWKWFNGGEPFSFKDNFNGWNVGDINFGALLSSYIDASYDKEVHKFNFVDNKGLVDKSMTGTLSPDGVGGRVMKGSSSGFYAFIQFAGVVHVGKSS